MSYPPKSSQASRAWDLVNKPLWDKPSIWANNIADRIDQPRTGSSTFDPNSFMGRWEELGNEGLGMVRGGIAGGIQGAGDLISGMTSPLNLGLTALGAPWTRSMGAGISSLGRLSSEAPIASRAIGGIRPSVLPEWTAVGEESGYNAGRSLFKPKSVEDLAYEVVRSGRDPIRRQIGGNFNVADMMAKTNNARGR